VKSGGFKTAALSLAFTNQNAVEKFLEAGLFVAVEGVVGTATVIPAGAQAFIPQIEGIFQLQNTIAALEAGVHHGLPLAIGTTYGGLDTPDGSAWKKLAKFPIERVFVECYKDDGPPHDNIDVMLHQGEVYGIPKELLLAICGTYRGEFPSNYTGLTKSNFGGIYNIPQTNDVQLDQWARLATSVTPPAPVIPDSTVIKQNARAVLHQWLDPNMALNPPKPQSKSLIRMADRLLALSIPQQADFNEDLLLAELDRVGSPKT